MTGSSVLADADGPRIGAMLSRLSIRDIVLIDRLDIDFAAGLDEFGEADAEDICEGL